MSADNRAYTLEEMSTILEGLEKNTSYIELGKKVGRQANRIAQIQKFYKDWSQTGRIWPRYRNVGKLFKEYHEKNKLPLPANSFALPPTMTSTRRDPYTEVDVLIENFRSQLHAIVKGMVKDSIMMELTSLSEKIASKEFYKMKKRRV